MVDTNGEPTGFTPPEVLAGLHTTETATRVPIAGANQPESKENIATDPHSADRMPPAIKEGMKHTENGEGSTITTPRIAEFPKNLQPVLTKTYEKVQAGGQRVNGLVSIVDQVQATYKARVHEVAIIEQIAREEVPKNKRAEVNQAHAQAVAELRLLKRANDQIQAGKDAPELRITSWPYSGKDWAMIIDDADVRQYGKTRNPIALVRRVMQARSDAFSQGSQRFRNNMLSIYDKRVKAFVDHFVNNRIQNPNQRNVFLGVHTEIVALHAVTDQADGQISEQFATGYDRLNEAAKKVALQAAKQGHTLKWLNEYVRQHAQEFKGVNARVGIGRKTASLPEVMQQLLEDHSSDIQALLDQLKTAPNTILGKIITKLDPTIAAELQGINDVAEAMPIHYPLPMVSGATVSEEVKNVLQSILTRTEDFAGHQTHDKRGLIQGTLDTVATLRGAEEQFPDLTETLWHITPYDLAKGVLRTGKLASRQYLVDQGGEATFLNEGIKVGKDYVVVGDTRMTKQEYDSLVRKKPTLYRKKADQEGHQVVFSRNGPYRGGYDQRRMGGAFVFSEPSLFAKSQFMESDGWHLFDPTYSHEQQNSPGFVVDLTREPFVIAVREQHREDFEAFVRNELATSEIWAATMPDPETWMAQHVTYLPHWDATTKNDVPRQAVGNVNKKFNKQYKIDVSRGRFMPTGEQGENAVQQLMPLFEYQAVA